MPRTRRVYFGLSRADEGRNAYMNAPKKRFRKQRAKRNAMARRSRRINWGLE